MYNTTSITRSELYEKYKNNTELVNDKLVNEKFEQICNYVMNYNKIGITKYSIDLDFSLGSIILIEKVVDKLKKFFIDSKIILNKKTITIDWSLPETEELIFDDVIDLKDNF